MWSQAPTHFWPLCVGACFDAVLSCARGRLCGDGHGFAWRVILELRLGKPNRFGPQVCGRKLPHTSSLSVWAPRGPSDPSSDSRSLSREESSRSHSRPFHPLRSWSGPSASRFLWSSKKSAGARLPLHSWCAKAATSAPDRAEKRPLDHRILGIETNHFADPIRLMRGLKVHPRSMPEYEGQHPPSHTQSAPTQASLIPALHELLCNLSHPKHTHPGIAHTCSSYMFPPL